MLGRVRVPGLIELSGPISFWLLKGRRFEKDAGMQGQVKEDGKDAVIVVDLVSLLEGGDLTGNCQPSVTGTPLSSKSGMCYVTGEVSEPGSYPCGSGAATVLKLIATGQRLLPAKPQNQRWRSHADSRTVKNDHEGC